MNPLGHVFRDPVGPDACGSDIPLGADSPSSLLGFLEALQAATHKVVHSRTRKKPLGAQSGQNLNA